MVNILPFGGCTSPENPSVQAAAAAMSVAMQAKPKGFIEKVISFFCKPKDNAQDDRFVSQCAGVCTPIIVTPWQNGKDIVEIDGKPALLASSCVSCLYKGEITFTTDGQSESTEQQGELEDEEEPVLEEGQQSDEVGGLPFPKPIVQPEPVSHEALMSIIALRKIYDEYESKDDLSGMDATIREIQRIQQENNFPVQEYKFASEKKTTRVVIEQTQTFEKSDIQGMHKRDDIVEFMAGLIPGVGVGLASMYSLLREEEQNGSISIGNVTKNIAMGVLNVKNQEAGTVIAISETVLNLSVMEKEDVYNRDGLTIKDADTYIKAKLTTNQGLSVTTVKVYMRNDQIISYEEFNAASAGVVAPPNGGLSSSVINDWKRDGYE
jgi:hypothetical protein